jgi:Sulfotransferase domain
MPRNGCETIPNNGSALPSFFIIGPPRTGTTWLHNVLSQCASLSHPTKETRFFDQHFDLGLEWYRSHFRKVPDGRVIGEVAPTYFASPLARERIARMIPQAKIVCVFRNPVDRVLSLYRLKRAYGLIRWSFEQALENDPELIETSRYAFHLHEWKQTFGDAQVMMTVHEDIESDPQSYLDGLANFIGLPRLKLKSQQLRHVLTSEDMTEPRHYYWTRGALLLSEWARRRRLDRVVATAKRMGGLKLFIGGGRTFAELSPLERERLRQLFRPEVDQLETMLNRSFAAWK